MKEKIFQVNEMNHFQDFAQHASENNPPPASLFFFIISSFFIIAENKTEFTRLSSLSFQEASFPPQLKKENDREKEAQEQLRDDRSREDDDSNSWPANQVIERPEAIVEEIG